ASPGPSVDGGAVQVPTVEGDPAPCPGPVAHDGSEGRRLPDAVVADETHRLARADTQRDALDPVAPALVRLQGLELQQPPRPRRTTCLTSAVLNTCSAVPSAIFRPRLNAVTLVAIMRTSSTSCSAMTIVDCVATRCSSLPREWRSWCVRPELGSSSNRTRGLL